MISHARPNLHTHHHPLGPPRAWDASKRDEIWAKSSVKFPISLEDKSPGGQVVGDFGMFMLNITRGGRVII